jgi:hypothetical protein
MITIKLKDGLYTDQEQWLSKNVGRRLHHLHNSIGGEGWLVKQYTEQIVTETSDGEKYTTNQRIWKLTLENESYASFFLMMFPQ